MRTSRNAQDNESLPSPIFGEGWPKAGVRSRVDTRNERSDTIPILRPYQREAGRAIVESVMRRDGMSISVEIARQGGKNELSAQVEMLLLAAHSSKQIEAVKCAPTYRPQLRISMLRLWNRLHRAGLRSVSSMWGDTISVGDARVVFLSAEPAPRRDAPDVPHAVLPADDQRRRPAAQRIAAGTARGRARAAVAARRRRSVRRGPRSRRRR